MGGKQGPNHGGSLTTESAAETFTEPPRSDRGKGTVKPPSIHLCQNLGKENQSGKRKHEKPSPAPPTTKVKKNKAGRSSLGQYQSKRPPVWKRAGKKSKIWKWTTKSTEVQKTQGSKKGGNAHPQGHRRRTGTGHKRRKKWSHYSLDKGRTDPGLLKEQIIHR